MLDSSTVRFEILEHIGVLSEEGNGWRKEVNLVRWDRKEPQYDIRNWSADYKYMSRGITLTEGEIRNLIQHFNVRRKTTLRDRLTKAEKQHDHQFPGQKKGRKEAHR